MHVSSIANQRGVSVIELLVYLGVSSLIMVGIAGFMVRTATVRAEQIRQQVSQQAFRQIVASVTYAVRNAYDSEILAGGSGLRVYSHVGDDANPVTSISDFLLQGDMLYFGQEDTMPPPLEALAPIHEIGTSIERVEFQEIGSSIVLDLAVSKDGKVMSGKTTITTRQ